MSANVTCQACGVQLGPGQSFCNMCGATVQESAVKATRRHGPWIVVGVALVLAAGVGVVLANPGLLLPAGASDPDALMADLTAALNEGDVRVLAGLVHPHEIDPFVDVLPATIDRLRAEGLLEEGDAGTQLEVTLEDLEYDVDELVEGVARIDIEDGRLVIGGLTPATIDELRREGLPLSSDDGVEVDLGELADEQDVFLVAVEHGGGWYLSLIYTLMEIIVEEERIDGIEEGNELLLPPPAESPSAAIEAFVEAFAEEEYEQMVGSIFFPGDFTAHYADALDEIVELLYEDEVYSEGFDPSYFSLDDLDIIETDLGGGLVELAIEGFRVENDGPDYKAAIDFDGECFIFEESDREDEECPPDDFAELSGIEHLSIVVRKLGEGYVLDLAATYANYLQQVVEGADGAVIRKVLGLPEATPTPDSLEEGGGTIELDVAGTWVGEFAAEAGDVLAVQQHGLSAQVYKVSSSQVYVVGPDGTRQYLFGCANRAPCLYRVETSGDHRLVLDAYELGEEEVRLGLDLIDTLPAILELGVTDVDLGAGEVVLYEVAPAGGEVRLTGDYIVVEGGEAGTDTFTRNAVIAVTGGIAGGSARVIATEPPPVGFVGGGLTRSGSVLVDDVALFLAIIPEGQTVLVRVVPTNSSFDPVLELYSDTDSDFADRGYAGDFEEGFITAGVSGQIEIYVSGWGQTSGLFTVEIIP